MSTISSTPPIPADVQHFPVIPSYVVALSVVAAVLVTAMVIFILYSCLVQRSKKRLWTTVQQSPTRETEQLREETAEEHDVPLTDTATLVTEHMKPKPSPSIFSRGDFLMEVLEGVENTTDLSIAGDFENTSHLCEADCVTVAMDDLEEDDNYSATPVLSTPPRQSATMDLFLENLSTASLTCGTLGLRVREDCQADASTAALRGSISSGEGESGSEGGEVIVCVDIEIFEDPALGEINEDPAVGEINEDPVVGEIYKDPVVGEIYEDPILGEIYEDPVLGEIYEDPVVGDIYEDPVVGEIYEDLVVCSVKEVEVGIECHGDEIEELVNDDEIDEKNSRDENKSTAAPAEEIPKNLAICFHENAFTIPEVFLEDDQVENCQANESVIREEELFSVEVGDGDIEVTKENEDEGYEYSSTSSPTEIPSPSLTMPNNTSSHHISGQDDGCSRTPLQASTCLAELELTPAPSMPFNIIPVSSQKDPMPNTLSAQLSHSTPTSLLHPLVSMHALPLPDRALSVSHLSLNRSGKHLPATPLSCNSEYSPVYNMQFGSARRLATDQTASEVAVMDRSEVEGNECEEDEVDVLSPDDASGVIQELK